MARRSPTLEGFRLMWSRPSLGLAEIIWRWSFWAGAWAMVLFAAREYLNSLVVGRRDLFLLQTRQPVLVSKALSHIFRGSSLRVAISACVIFVALSGAWVIVATLGRAVSVRELYSHFREAGAVGMSLRSLAGIHFLRAAVTVASLVGMLSAVLAAGAVNSAAAAAPGGAMLVFLAILLIISLVWSLLNWILSLAAIFVVDGRDAFSAIGAAVDMIRDRIGPVTAVSSWFGLAHIVIWSAASSVIAFPLAFASILPVGLALGGVLFVTLLYFAIVDWLYVGRLAAYIAILELPEVETTVTKDVATPPVVPVAPSGRIDPNELILSDVPV